MLRYQPALDASDTDLQVGRAQCVSRCEGIDRYLRPIDSRSQFWLNRQVCQAVQGRKRTTMAVKRELTPRGDEIVRLETGRRLNDGVKTGIPRPIAQGR